MDYEIAIDQILDHRERFTSTSVEGEAPVDGDGVLFATRCLAQDWTWRSDWKARNLARYVVAPFNPRAVMVVA